jgi:predicted secreted Zn-dependent protease
MSKETQATPAQADRKNRLNVEQRPDAQQNMEQLLEEPVAGVAMTAHGGRIDAQAAQLRDTRLQVAQRRAIASRIGRKQGNNHLQRVIARAQGSPNMAAIPSVQREDESVPMGGGSKGGGKGGGGSGPGSMQNSTEQPYDVSGATLTDVATQLTSLGGFAAETNTPLGLSGTVAPTSQPDGTYRVQVTWQINGATTRLPRWTGYSAACSAAKGEWDRFMTQVRAHEQAAHVNAARDFCSNLGEADTVITGASVDEVRTNLQAKQQELAARLQTMHNGCGHGADIDAILHPDNGRCEESVE